MCVVVRSAIDRPPRRGSVEGAMPLGLQGFGVVSPNSPNISSAVPSGLEATALPPSLERLGYSRLSLRDTPRRYVSGFNRVGNASFSGKEVSLVTSAPT